METRKELLLQLLLYRNILSSLSCINAIQIEMVLSSCAIVMLSVQTRGTAFHFILWRVLEKKELRIQIAERGS